eukprot:13537-Heterococcus_DN1.PRE.3
MANRVGYWFSDRAGLLGYNTNQSLNLGVVFEAWVSLDAFIVLSGAVLTAYVGITGLIRRMAKVRRVCLDALQLLLQRTFQCDSAVAAEQQQHCTTAALANAAQAITTESSTAAARAGSAAALQHHSTCTQQRSGTQCSTDNDLTMHHVTCYPFNCCTGSVLATVSAEEECIEGH